MEPATPRTRLEQRVHGARLSVPEFVAQFAEQAMAAGERTSASVSGRQVKRWFSGESKMPGSVAQRVLEHWWNEPVERLFGPPDGTSGRVRLTEKEVIVNAGRESVEHAIEAASALDSSALEHLHAAARQAAHAYYVAPPLQMLTDLVRLRDTVYEQLDRTHKPRQQAELYLVAGQVCGLLSSVS